MIGNQHDAFVGITGTLNIAGRNIKIIVKVTAYLQNDYLKNANEYQIIKKKTVVLLTKNDHWRKLMRCKRGVKYVSIILTSQKQVK